MQTASGGDLPARGLRHPLAVDERPAGADRGELLGASSRRKRRSATRSTCQISTAAFSFSSPAFTLHVHAAAHRYTGSRSSSRCCCHVSCSSGQPAFGRAIELADNVAHVGVGAERWLGAGAEPIVEAQAAPVQRLQWP